MGLKRETLELQSTNHVFGLRRPRDDPWMRTFFNVAETNSVASTNTLFRNQSSWALEFFSSSRSPKFVLLLLMLVSCLLGNVLSLPNVSACTSLLIHLIYVGRILSSMLIAVHPSIRLADPFRPSIFVPKPGPFPPTAAISLYPFLSIRDAVCFAGDFPELTTVTTPNWSPHAPPY